MINLLFQNTLLTILTHWGTYYFMKNFVFGFVHLSQGLYAKQSRIIWVCSVESPKTLSPSSPLSCISGTDWSNCIHAAQHHPNIAIIPNPAPVLIKQGFSRHSSVFRDTKVSPWKITHKPDINGNVWSTLLSHFLNNKQLQVRTVIPPTTTASIANNLAIIQDTSNVTVEE